MNGSEAEDEESGTRIIDRSGDIDQRPPEEKSAPLAATIVPFKSATRRETSAAAPPRPARPLYVQSDSDARPPAVAAGLAELAQRLQRDIDKRYDKAKSQLDAIAQKIAAQEKHCKTPKLDAELQQIRQQRQQILVSHGPLLADCLREERSRFADLERFKAENRLTREAHYPASPVLGFGILSILILVETSINGVLFADSSERGLLGGWLEAVVLAATNVGAAFLFGRLVLPQLHRRALIARGLALAASAIGLAAIVAINLAGAHYRDFKAAAARSDAATSPAIVKRDTSVALSGAKPQGPALPAPKAVKAAAPAESGLPSHLVADDNAAERRAIRDVLANPLGLQGFGSFFLLIIGLCGAVIAICDGYRLDDPFPGYGKRHRRAMEARSQSTDALRKVLNQSSAVMTGSFQAISRKIESHAEELATLFALHHAYAGELRSLKDALDEAARDAEAEIAWNERLSRKISDRGTSDFYAIAVKPFPPLGEAHLRFYETQEKKLKALQKSAQKEQEDSLGMFAAASADFQKLLTEAAQGSLRLAGIGASSPVAAHS